jgi:hypothetical protein
MWPATQRSERLARCVPDKPQTGNRYSPDPNVKERPVQRWESIQVNRVTLWIHVSLGSKSLRTIFVSLRKRHVLVSYKAQNPSRGWWPRLVLQRRRSLKQVFSSPYKDRAQALSQ